MRNNSYADSFVSWPHSAAVCTALLVIAVTAPASAQSCAAGSVIQTQLNALVSTGGKIDLPCGCWTLSTTLTMPTHTTIQGRGTCTVLYAPPGGTAINGDYNTRKYGLAVRDLLIDGRPSGATQDGYIGVDFRNVSSGKIRDVYIQNFQTGVLVWATPLPPGSLPGTPENGAYYNVIEDVHISASVSGIELLSGANDTIVRGGKVSSLGPPGPATMHTGIWIRDNSNVKIDGVAIEPLCRTSNPGIPCSRGIRVDAGTYSANIHSVRFEEVDIGVQIDSGSQYTRVLAGYCTALTTPYVDQSNSFRWVGLGCGAEQTQ